MRFIEFLINEKSLEWDLDTGKTYDWTPWRTKGKDGKTYYIIGCWGQPEAPNGQYQRTFFHLPERKIIKVKVIDTAQKFGTKRAILCKVISGTDQKSFIFARRPYVEKDNTFEVISHPAKLSDQSLFWYASGKVAVGASNENTLQPSGEGEIVGRDG